MFIGSIITLWEGFSTGEAESLDKTGKIIYDIWLHKVSPPSSSGPFGLNYW